MPVGLLVMGHQGGWDEIALVAGPLTVIAGLLWLADHRAGKSGSPRDPGTD
ncbi:MAG: hypothetical protein P8M16_11350 [Acidimicrobiales bacterium]|nr:hypothetical protein [Acidimicrobiales bacterium]